MYYQLRACQLSLFVLPHVRPRWVLYFFTVSSPAVCCRHEYNFTTFVGGTLLITVAIHTNSCGAGAYASVSLVSRVFASFLFTRFLHFYCLQAWSFILQLSTGWNGSVMTTYMSKAQEFSFSGGILISAVIFVIDYRVLVTATRLILVWSRHDREFI